MPLCRQHWHSIWHAKKPPARNGTNISSFCPIWTGDAHRSRQNSIKDRMHLLPPHPQFFQHKHAREKAAIAIQRAYRHTHKSRREQPFCALRETIEMTTKPKHKIGTTVSKIFKDDNGMRRPFAGAIESYDEMRKLYMIVYEDGDSEELTHKEGLTFFKMTTSNRTMQPTPRPTTLSLSPSTTFPVGSRVTIIPSHHVHGGKDGVVTQHTKKFVVIVLNGTKTCILPKLLTAHSPNSPPLMQEHNNPTNPSPPLDATSDTYT